MVTNTPVGGPDAVDGEAINPDSVGLTPQDLSTLSPGADDDGVLFLHDGTGTITVNGVQTSRADFYRWDNDAGEWARIGLERDIQVNGTDGPGIINIKTN